METGTYNPRVMYHATGSTRRVDSPQMEKALLASEWSFTPYPPPPEPEKPKSIQDQIDQLRAIVEQHDAVLMKRVKGAK